MAHIREEVIKMIEKAKGAPVPVGDASDLYADLGFDSLSFTYLLLKMEEKYSITFDIMEMDACLQVDRLIALIELKVMEQSNHD